ncbi:hypothetical protein HDV00_010845 [Rhizophlyctis rosea]|nr:hypothetical protein HDV00_010845 [Rhizophlyctis rosea]
MFSNIKMQSNVDLTPLVLELWSRVNKLENSHEGGCGVDHDHLLRRVQALENEVAVLKGETVSVLESHSKISAEPAIEHRSEGDMSPEKVTANAHLSDEATISSAGIVVYENQSNGELPDYVVETVGTLRLHVDENMRDLIEEMDCLKSRLHIVEEEQADSKVRVSVINGDLAKIKECLVSVKKKEPYYQKMMEEKLGGTHLRIFSNGVLIGITDITTEDAHFEIKVWDDYAMVPGQLGKYNRYVPKASISSIQSHQRRD